MYVILDGEKTHLHAMIRITPEQIDTILQGRKTLQAREEKLGRVFKMINKVLKDLEAEENIVEQAKSSIENLDRRITEMQNHYIRHSDLSHITVAAARSVITII